MWPTLFAFLLAAFLLASTKPAAPPADPTRVALARQFVFAHGAGRCTRAELSTAVANARIERIGTLAGDPVVLAMLYGQCLSGAANTPWLIIRVSAAARKPLLSISAQNVDVIRSNDALPRIREQMHNSADISNVRIDVFRAGRYVAIDSYEMRNEHASAARGPLMCSLRRAHLPRSSSENFGRSGDRRMSSTDRKASSSRLTVSPEKGVSGCISCRRPMGRR
jgi:hypothetical protein